MGKFSGIKNPAVSWTHVDPDTLDLSGRRVAVVGGTGGIGRALARRMVRLGADVTVVGRTLRDESHPRVRFLAADLSSMVEAERVGRVLATEAPEMLVFTNGIMSAPEREETEEGIERDLAISFLSRLAIARIVAPALDSSRSVPPRIFVMGFPGTGESGNVDDFNSERVYQAFAAHMNTVAGNEALVLDLAERHPSIDAFGLNPGLIKTGIRSNYLGAGSLEHRVSEWLIGLLTPSADSYARRITPLMFSPDLAGASGAHFNAKGHAILPSSVMTKEYVRRIIDQSHRLLAKATALSRQRRQ